MDKIIEGLQFGLDTIAAGTSTLSSVGAGTEAYGVAEQKVASGTNSFVAAFKTVFNFCAYIAGLFGASIGTLA